MEPFRGHPWPPRPVAWPPPPEGGEQAARHAAGDDEPTEEQRALQELREKFGGAL